MLRTLNIENIAVIEKAEIEFNNGLNVLTGETGAGKSIVVDSINAILGERTSKELVRHGAEFAFVSAYFSDVNEAVSSRLAELGFECDDGDLLLSRRISAEGKSSCRINGRAATVSVLKEIGHLLVNIHGQHDSQALLNPDYYFRYIDMLSDNKSLIAEYKSAFSELIKIRRQLKILTTAEDTKDKDIELLEYQVKEIEAADIKIGEFDALTERKKLIDNSETLLKAYNGTLSALNGDDENNGIILTINSQAAEIEPFSDNLDAFEILSALSSATDALEVLKQKLDGALSNLDFDESEREQIEERLDLLFRIKKKYGETEEQILSFLENAKEKLELIAYDDKKLEELNAQYDAAYDKALSLAEALSSERKKTAKRFENAVKEQLEFLDMPKIQFIVNFDKGILSSNGFDKIEFLISTNVGEPPKPLAKIASGGELSRIMLAIKNIIAANDTIGTLIFDEIDTGVSGRASRKIGLKLKSVAESTQVITVTHSAQIASVADAHSLIQKDYDDSRTYTSIKPLDYEGRKLELARIMGGLNITDAMLASAEELLSSDK
jgi:DNA repair protein RecN (Recombination protein N)